MVNPALLLSTLPLASVASALYIPHDDDPAFVKAPADAPADVASEEAQAHAAKQLPKKKGGRPSRKGCKHKAQALPVELTREADAYHGAAGHSQPELKGVISHADEKDIIPDSYIVVLKQDAPKTALATNLEWLLETSGVQLQNLLQRGESHPLAETSTGFDIKKVYDMGSQTEGAVSAFRGYAGKFLPQVAELLAEHPDVAFVERDSKVHTLTPKEEDQAPWGLARVSHRDPLGLSSYNKYLYDKEAGEGVTSYIVDTGIYVDHEDFEGRAVWGKTMPAGDEDIDAHGHGSHCAGTIGGKKYGVAKKAKLVAVKVLGSDGSGSMSDVIGGVEYVVESHRAEKKEKKDKLKGSTANMSLGGGKSPSLDIAVNAATEAGVHFAVAAGNENQDACNVSPAGAKGPVTVGATTVKDERAYFSNYGKCVDIFAPGVNVLSVGTYSPSSSAIMSGTSMASPHIAGLLTYFVSLQPSTDSEYAVRGELTTDELKKHLISFGTPDLLTDLDAESPNVLAFNGGGKDISDFWVAGNGEDSDEDEDESLLEKIGEKIEHGYESVGEMVEDLLEGSQELISDLF